VDAAKSSLAFSSKQMGVPVPGNFKRFTSQISFDPAKPTAASTTLEIDLASIDAGSKDANDEVVGKQWFNVKAFPTAKFVSTGVKALGGNRYEALGKMTIKGQTRDVVAPSPSSRKAPAASSTAASCSSAWTSTSAKARGPMCPPSPTRSRSSSTSWPTAPARSKPQPQLKT
jgi:polyisoprenoid-binding protein YceI